MGDELIGFVKVNKMVTVQMCNATTDVHGFAAVNIIVVSSSFL